MRKALFLVLVLSLVGCGESAEEASSNGGTSGATPSGDGDDAVHGGNAATPGSAEGSESAPPVSGGGGPGGGPGGSASGTLGASGAGSVGGSAGAGFGGVAGGGSAVGAIGSGATPGGASPTVVSGTGSAAADAGAPIPPSQDPRALTAGVWDDNLNYTRFHEFRSSVQQSRTSGVLPFGNEEFEAAHQKFSASRSARQQLDVALMIDTTGSMGDEIAYLQREFSDLSRSIESAYPNAAQRWALVVYRDQGDEYVANAFNFVEDKETFREKLAKQSAGGGGDTPEAPEAAFAALNQLEWRTAPDVARLVFWVADAPHHDGAAAALADGVRKTRDLDVHVYPVASSGVDELTELSMRSAAQLTGGRYLFLTDDSGIGGAHKEPTIPCYFVTTLKNAITRVVDIELSGTYREPLAAQIIRTGGDPKNGACKLADETLQVF